MPSDCPNKPPESRVYDTRKMPPADVVNAITPRHDSPVTMGHKCVVGRVTENAIIYISSGTVPRTTFRTCTNPCETCDDGFDAGIVSSTPSSFCETQCSHGLDRENDVGSLPVGLVSIGHFEAELPHPLRAFARLAATLLLLDCVTTVLAPEPLLASLSLPLKALNYVDGTSAV